MKTIATCSKAEEAHLVRGRLEAAGIRAFIQDENLAQMDWLYSNAIGGVRVQVAEEDFEAAQVLLSADAGEAANGLSVDCPRCGSPDTGPDEFPRRVAFLTMLFLGAPLLFSRDRWQCRACSHRWKPEPRPLSFLAILFPTFLVTALLVATATTVMVYANRFLNDLLVLFAAFGLLIFFAHQMAKRRSEARPEQRFGEPKPPA